MVLLAGLPLVSCSESIKTVSISGFYKVTDQRSSSLLTRYKRRDASMSNLSLHQFFFEAHKNEKNTCVPHYVGSSTTPKYPLTESYARSMLLIHKPWIKSWKKPATTCVEEFTSFLQQAPCPKSVKLAVARAKARHENGDKYKEPTAEASPAEGGFRTDTLDDETRHFMEFVTSFNQNIDPNSAFASITVNRGLDFDWGQKTNAVSFQFNVSQNRCTSDTNQNSTI